MSSMPSSDGAPELDFPLPMKSLAREVINVDRVEILHRLAVHPYSVTALADEVRLVACDASRHLARLLKHQLVAYHKDGKMHHYRLAHGIRAEVKGGRVTVYLPTREGVEVAIEGNVPTDRFNGANESGPDIEPFDKSKLA